MQPTSKTWTVLWFVSRLFEAARRLHELGQADMTVLHFQFDGFEHYDCMSLANSEPAMPEIVRNRLPDRLRVSPFERAMTFENPHRCC